MYRRLGVGALQETATTPHPQGREQDAKDESLPVVLFCFSDEQCSEEKYVFDCSPVAWGGALIWPGGVHVEVKYGDNFLTLINRRLVPLPNAVIGRRDALLAGVVKLKSTHHPAENS